MFVRVSAMCGGIHGHDVLTFRARTSRKASPGSSLLTSECFDGLAWPFRPVVVFPFHVFDASRAAVIGDVLVAIDVSVQFDSVSVGVVLLAVVRECVIHWHSPVQLSHCVDLSFEAFASDLRFPA